jgi:hypothetical protein
LFFDGALAESPLESRLVLAVLEDNRVFHPSHHAKVQGARSRICLGAEFKNNLNPHILPAQKHQKPQGPFIFVLKIRFVLSVDHSPHLCLFL